MSRKLAEWTKPALIEEIKRLEALLPPKKKQPKPPKSKRPMDFSKHAARPIALKIAYLGWNYHGLSSQENDQVETVEGQLFKALEKAKMIPDRKQCRWSRCGRTDKGVSSFGQVVSLTIRSALPKQQGFSVEWPNAKGMLSLEQNLEKSGLRMPLEEESVESADIPMENESVNKTMENEQELNYMDILNRLLPSDIRIVAWSPVSPDFNARFSCQYRHYHYFFNGQNLSISKMQKAAEKYVGTHDFRHFCKVDMSKPEQSFIRTVLETKIEAVDHAQGFYYFSVKGHAFLWHQVRCMMSILFMVGQELEAPEIVDYLLDLSQHPPDAGRPAYEMAEDYPLVLVDCGYSPDALQWQYSPNMDKLVSTVFFDQWKRMTIKSTLLRHFYNVSSSLSTVQPCSKKHVPIHQRDRCDSLATRKLKSEAHAAKKLKLEE